MPILHNKVIDLTDNTLIGSVAEFNAALEGADFYTAGGTDIAIADGGTGASDAATARTNLGVGTGDSPQFTGVNVGHATDTTLTRASAGVVAVEGNNLLTAATNFVWTTYTPTVTAGSGSFTTVSATGRHLIIGKITHIHITVTITTNGTAAGSVVVTLPNTGETIRSVLVGREGAVTGNMLQGVIQPTASTMDIYRYDNAYPGASGHVLVMSGIYENA